MARTLKKFSQDDYNNAHSKLRNFISDFCGISEEEISAQASLEKDLRIYGDDAIELLVAYGKKFSVNVSNFMAADYFSGEGDVILPTLLRWITGRPKKEKNNLTVDDLITGMLHGRLDENILNKSNVISEEDSVKDD